jgi:hypothetical protein
MQPIIGGLALGRQRSDFGMTSFIDWHEACGDVPDSHTQKA